MENSTLWRASSKYIVATVRFDADARSRGCVSWGCITGSLPEADFSLPCPRIPVEFEVAALDSEKLALTRCAQTKCQDP
jgi:hypothetical protein